MEEKKPTRAQIERRLNRAILHIDRTKDTQTFFFSDRGIRLTVNEGYAIIETAYHRHVFNNITSSGVSRPYLYTKRLIDIALDNDCETADGYSFAKLLETLKAKEDKSEYNIVIYTDWWIYNSFNSLYSISESEIGSFMVYFDYIFGIAKNSVLLSEKNEDVTNKQFIDKVIANIKDFTENLTESVLFQKKTDEELAQENIAAIQETETEQALEEQANGSED